jgi:hypothetical protein
MQPTFRGDQALQTAAMSRIEMRLSLAPKYEHRSQMLQEPERTRLFILTEQLFVAELTL